MVLKYFTDGDFRFHSYILKEKVRQCKEKVQTLTESHDLHQSGVATFFIKIPYDEGIELVEEVDCLGISK